MYISGRLHKPVLPLIVPHSDHLRSALQLNLQSALHTALLLLPEVFTEENLYHTLTGLSYTGGLYLAYHIQYGSLDSIPGSQLTSRT